MATIKEDIPSGYAIRQELEELVLKDLLGPSGGPEEELDERSVRDRYIVGVLAPKVQRTDPEIPENAEGEGVFPPLVEDDDMAVGGSDQPEEGTPDRSPGGRRMIPASFGLTFHSSLDASVLKITVRWGHYEKTESETIKNPKTGEPKRVWRRKPVELTRKIRLEVGPKKRWTLGEEYPGVYLVGLSRKYPDGWSTTLFLVNEQHEPERLRDQAWLFQAEMMIEDEHGAPVFCKRPVHREWGKTDFIEYEDELTLDMIYRRYVEFATGHGVGVHADLADGDRQKAARISTRVVPEYEIPRTNVSLVEGASGLILDMKTLAELKGQELKSALLPLPAAYAAWIELQALKINDPQEGLEPFKEVAKTTLEKCRDAKTRIEEGIAQLEKDEKSAEAFRFLNKAMWLQRIHTIYSERKRRGEAVELDQIDADPKNHSWFPFQLGFILLNLPSIADLKHPDRVHPTNAVADLLWFPTGGGKTEAYLGLAAFTMGLRRLQGMVAGKSGEDGLAVIMRYTLRLLTLQQFQRASALICACEHIRREAESQNDTRWGKTPFRLGLWVGGRVTPNTTEKAAEAVKLSHSPQRGILFGGSGSPAQLKNCPWCGAAIDAGKHIIVDPFQSGRGRTITYCGDAKAIVNSADASHRAKDCELYW